MYTAFHQKGFSHHFLLPLIAIIAVGAIGLYMLSLSDAATAPGDRTGVKAKRAYDFTNSQGVVVHVDEDSYTDPANVLAALQYVGIRNIRTDYPSDGAVRQYLAQNNIRFHYTTRMPQSLPLATTPESRNALVAATMENRAVDLLTRPETDPKYVSSTVSAEPLNEYSKQSGNDPVWPDTVAYAQQQLWSKKPRLTAVNPNVKILGPSMIGYNLISTSEQLKDKNLAPYMDLGNVHSYYGGTTPETNLETNDGLNGFVVDPAPATSRNIAERLQLYSTRISGTKRVVVTEMGYHDYMEVDEKLHKPTDSRAVGVYMPRAYLENFRIGVLRSYAYQLFDEIDHKTEYEKHFGMFRTEGSTNPKPSADAMHVLNTIMNDTQTGATSFRTAKLNYTIVDKPDNVHEILMQKRSGKFYLAVWTDESVYDVGSETYHDPAAPTPLTIRFGRTRTVKAYYDGSATPTVVGSGKRTYPIHAGAKVSIFEIQ